MTGSVYCLDNDIILKLSTCGLFEKTLNTFGVEINQVKILQTFQYKFKRQAQQTRKKNPNKRQFKNETHQPQELTKKGSSGTV